jgi:tRNA (guanine37-N1)-methyltransferase
MDFIAVTIFPEMFAAFWENGIIRRAIERNIISASAINIRDFAKDRHQTTDDRPYGGGCGMVMKPEPLSAAILSAKNSAPESKLILMTPQGRRFDQALARELSRESGLIFVCGRYEGLDERACEDCIDQEISIGDYVLTGGELPAMIVMDALTRLLPDALGGEDSAEKDSFSEGLLEHAHYTRPRLFEGKEVPEVLLSGNHKDIGLWRLENSLRRTFLKRPDLLENKALTPPEVEILRKWRTDIERIIQSQTLSGADSLSGGE